jgi:cysteine desulfurase
VALEKALRLLPEEVPRLLALRRRLEAGLLAVEGVELNGHPERRLPKLVNVTVKGADGEALLLTMDLLGVAVSSGSACSAGSLEPSHVLLAIGRSPKEARASLRFSWAASPRRRRWTGRWRPSGRRWPGPAKRPAG